MHSVHVVLLVGSALCRAKNTKYFILKIYHGTECVDLVCE